jgi:hypothetical protein
MAIIDMDTTMDADTMTTRQIVFELRSQKPKMKMNGTENYLLFLQS